MDTYSLQLRNWLSSSVAQAQELTAFGIKQLINLKQKISFALFFNVCKYSLQLFLWNENESFSFGVKYFDFQIFFFSGQFDTKSEYQLYFFINNYSKHFQTHFNFY